MCLLFLSLCADWLKIVTDLERNYYDYDGFVIIHGTGAQRPLSLSLCATVCA
jgi:glutaredoxin-related protein